MTSWRRTAGSVVPLLACATAGFAQVPGESVVPSLASDRYDRRHGIDVPYPYEKLAHVQSATKFGGMENPGSPRSSPTRPSISGSATP